MLFLVRVRRYVWFLDRGLGQCTDFVISWRRDDHHKVAWFRYVSGPSRSSDVRVGSTFRRLRVDVFAVFVDLVIGFTQLRT